MVLFFGLIISVAPPLKIFYRRPWGGVLIGLTRSIAVFLLDYSVRTDLQGTGPWRLALSGIHLKNTN